MPSPISVISPPTTGLEENVESFAHSRLPPSAPMTSSATMRVGAPPAEIEGVDPAAVTEDPLRRPARIARRPAKRHEWCR